MKKVIVYTVLPVLLVAYAAGCGMANENQRLPSASPVISASPEVVPTPDVGNGVVNDRDGVITPGDNGLRASPSPTARPGGVLPSASPSATPDM